ncbi:MAG TPA: hypothetical protein VIK71_02845 [Flavobacteriales bacterium]
MNKFLLSSFFMVISFCTHAQLERLVLERVDSSSYGITYRVYAAVKSAGDQILVVFGDQLHELRIESTAPFFQSTVGGALATQVRKNQLEIVEELRYDSWLTIGYENNYENRTKTLGLELTTFEQQGAKIEAHDGAWYCLPTDQQTVADDTKQILLMQLTTKGHISGTLSLMGRTVSGENFEVRGISFSSH